MTLKLIGAALSPFVRKVRVALAEKGLAYEHDPMMPFGVSDEYKRKHPLGKIPCLEVDGRPLPDSSAILAYLEKREPGPALYPSDPYEHGRAVWFEEFADTGLLNGTIVFFQQRLLSPVFFKREPDEAAIQKAATETLPPLFDYLERELGDADYLVGNRFGVADIAVGSQFVNYRHGEGEVDAGRWPRLAAYVERVLARPSFKGLIEEEQNGIKAMRG
ncbi:MAG: glutathione S-transferase family protein [Myxococcota bacterium]